MTNKISVKGVRVEYQTLRGVVQALDCPSFMVEGGESVAVMGTSGCGKSTLLGLLGGLSVPTAGTVTIDGTDISTLSEADRVAFRKENIGMVYQADNLLPFLTVSENLYLQLVLCEDTKNAVERIGDVLEKLGLRGFEGRFPDQLSGGQRQRVAIARAIVHSPKIILADEPTGALDDTNAENVIGLLLDLHKKLKTTLVVVTHDPKVARRLERTVTLISNREINTKTT